MDSKKENCGWSDDLAGGSADCGACQIPGRERAKREPPKIASEEVFNAQPPETKELQQDKPTSNLQPPT